MIRQVGYIISILCPYIILLNLDVLHSSSVVSKLEIIEEQIDSCENSEYQCKNGRCISKSFVCDGLLDCSDDSDETYDLCRNQTCGKQYFQCYYGACINKTYQCDGLKQCIDGSDEFAEICDAETHASIRDRRATDNTKSCTTPAVSSAGNKVTFLCADNTSQVCSPINGLVPERTIAVINCNSGFEKEKQDDEDDNTEYTSICRNKKWGQRLDQCLKICDKLNPVNVDLRCSRKGVNIPCDEKTVLLRGTTIRPSCKPTHKYSTDSPPTYFEMTCQSDGKWDQVLFSCTPECGRTFSNPKLLIKGGTLERFGDSPWHVAIYNQKNVLICGGTIITPNLVISAAHCFHGVGKFKTPINTNDYEVVVGKVTRNYNAIDNDAQKVHKIKEIRFSEKGYQGASTGYQADIAILVLEKKINISKTVLPACLDWVALRDSIYPEENSPGKVTGWGLNEHGNYSDTLMTVDLPFISHQRCSETVPEDFKQFITFDKFCAGSENGPGVLQGDSGGGLLYKKNNYYYLHGIVSIKQPTSTGIAAFTDLAEHVGWISKVRNEVEDELNKISTQIPTTTKATKISTQIPTATKATTRVASVKFPQSSLSPSSTPTTVECGIRKRYGQNSKSDISFGEFPWMVAILQNNANSTGSAFICGGSLLSRNVILTAAHCVYNIDIETLRVRVGEFVIDEETDERLPHQEQPISRISFHSDYSSKVLYNDLALIKVHDPFTFDDHVAPVCFPAVDTYDSQDCLLTGWSQNENNTVQKKLRKFSVSIMTQENCENSFRETKLGPRFKLHPSFLCAKKQESVCKGHGGGPLVCASRTNPDRYVQVGVVSWGIGCDSNLPGVYASLETNAEWLRDEFNLLTIF